MTAADTILPVLGGAVAVLACLAVLAAAVPARPVVTRVLGFTMATVAAVVAGLAVAVLLDGVRAVLPLGQGVTLAVDPIAASFLLPLGLAGIGAGCYGAGDRLSPLAPGLLAAAMLTVVAADGATLVRGLRPGAGGVMGIGPGPAVGCPSDAGRRGQPGWRAGAAGGRW